MADVDVGVEESIDDRLMTTDSLATAFHRTTTTQFVNVWTQLRVSLFRQL